MMFIIVFLPLVPIFLIFIKEKYDSSPMHYLVLVCLLDLIKELSGRLPLLDAGNQLVIRNIISLLQLAALVQLFKAPLARPVKAALNMVLIAFFSSILTWYSLLGWDRHGRIIDSIESALIIVTILLCMIPLIRDHMVLIFQSPFLHIAAGTLFSIMLCLLVEWVGPCCLPSTPVSDPDRIIFLSIAALVKYTLYTQSVLIARSPD